MTHYIEVLQHVSLFKPHLLKACWANLICCCRPEWHWEWVGNSLHPYYEGNDPVAMIDDDALIQATLPHWHWGHDGSGDIRRPANITAICNSVNAMAGEPPQHASSSLLLVDM